MNRLSSKYPVGTILSIRGLLYTHIGIMFPNNQVLNNSKEHGRVVLEAFDAFVRGRDVLAQEPQTKLSEREIISRGQSIIEKKYDVIKYNCEHMKCEVLGQPKHSPQLAGYAALGFLFLALFLFGGRRV